MVMQGPKLLDVHRHSKKRELTMEWVPEPEQWRNHNKQLATK
jgi:hypothetical protein